MYKVLVNDKKYVVEDGAPLDEVLAEYDGLPYKKNDGCGRRIRCSALPISENDKNFLTKTEREEGFRLSGDKTITQNLAVELFACDRNKLEYPLRNVVLFIDEKNVDVGLADDRLRETFTFSNPLSSFGDVSKQTEVYQSNGALCKTLLVSAIEKKLSELFRARNTDKAETIVVCAGGFFLSVLFGVPLSVKLDDHNAFLNGDVLGLPTEKLYVLPPAGDFVAGDVFCRSVTHKENSLLIDCGDNVTLLYIDKETNVYGYMWGMDYSPLSVLALRAAINVLRPEGYTPVVYLYGDRAYLVEDILSEDGLTCICERDDLSPLIKACLSTSFRSKILKDKQRTSFHDLLKDEKFQEEMISLQDDSVF